MTQANADRLYNFILINFDKKILPGEVFNGIIDLALRLGEDGVEQIALFHMFAQRGINQNNQALHSQQGCHPLERGGLLNKIATLILSSESQIPSWSESLKKSETSQGFWTGRGRE